ncbi:pyridoxal-phosphate dependent enzyme [Sphingomonas lacunae]|uniref:Pyridoxal-phosphate dependent enzyme n=1 Tax=Sphingomonas lacunae TaxID=2698828 RepID=A0A6M4AVE0_9SPHN|nr:pyridoxal-phosphate dependent enzyme [Sphingomonas lacunae]QJQ33078.1 pyridoxal-phosphate dependent enzyme [Sphingomonas lacunae]
MTEQRPDPLTDPERSPSREGVLRAAAKVAAILPPTPLLPLDLDGVTIWCKAEMLQPIGAFKIRGAWHRLSDLDEAQRRTGVVGVSSGNHAQGVAWAARRLGIPATIVMPNDAPRAKLAATRALGAEVLLYDRPGGEDRDAIAHKLMRSTGRTLVHPFGDVWVIEGQGSLGIEANAQLKTMVGTTFDTVVACCGGGGLTAGLALALPDTRLFAVEPEGWDDVGRSLATGSIQHVADPTPTACDALQTPSTYPINFAVLQRRNVTALTVSEAQIRKAMRLVFDRLHLVVEPGGAAALAAVLAGKVEVGKHTLVTLSGGNVDANHFAAMLKGSE